MKQSVPFVDLAAIHLPLESELQALLSRSLRESRFIGGEDVNQFEKDFAAFTGCTYAVACANGTDAIELALIERLGFGDGTGEIITSTHTFIATSEAITRAGYKPIFTDIDPKTYLLTAEIAEQHITPRTKAIIPVHLYGQMVEMAPLLKLAEKYKLAIIEDSAQAHGASDNGKFPGQLSDGATFSFYPAKNLGALGDGGAFVTNNEQLAKRVRMRANHGRLSKYEHEFEGQNSRLDSLQAAILSLKLKHLNFWNQQRQQIAAWYNECLKNVELVKPFVRAGASHVFHLYVVGVKNRESLMKKLKDDGIETGVHYPIPMHLQPAYKHLNLKASDFPTATQATQTILSLPLYPGMTQAQVQYVCERLIYHIAPTASLRGTAAEAL